jgi:hypothetical protein
MRIRTSGLLLLAAACVVGLPAWAAKDSVAHVSFDHDMTVAGTKLQAGDYDFRVKSDEDKVEIVRSSNQQVVATVPGKWVSLKNKAPYTQVLSDKDLVQELEFSGKTQAVEFSQTPNGSEGQD